MDKSDKFSIGVSAIGIVAIFFIIIYLPHQDTHVLNKVTVIGSVSSTAAAIIAIIQILKIKASNDAFLHAMDAMGNNLLIDVIARSIEQIRLIKEYFDDDKIAESRSNFNLLRTELIKVLHLSNSKEHNPSLKEFVTFCSIIEENIFAQTFDRSEKELTKVYAKLSELESLLQEINIKAKLVVKKEL